ncbi:MAG: type VI secretion system accessory protein TagJ [Planctomycetota bacterium]
MSAEQILQSGDLDKALEELQDEIRDDPGNATHRVFLFQLLTVLGNWERAAAQLKVAGELAPENAMLEKAYREVLKAEVIRAEVFQGKRSPTIFGEPDRWLALLMEALKLDAQGNYAESQRLTAEAFEDAPMTSGSLQLAARVSGTEADGAEAADEEPLSDPIEFSWIADVDTRLGPVFEAVVNGRYFWVPAHRVKEITIEPPSALRDAVWLPATFQWSNGGEAVGMIPTRYPGTESSDDAQLRLSGRSEMVEVAEGVLHGLGQRLFATDEEEYALMDIRKISLNVERADVTSLFDADAAADETAGGDGGADEDSDA